MGDTGVPEQLAASRRAGRVQGSSSTALRRDRVDQWTRACQHGGQSFSRCVAKCRHAKPNPPLGKSGLEIGIRPQPRGERGSPTLAPTPAHAHRYRLQRQRRQTMSDAAARTTSTEASTTAEPPATPHHVVVVAAATPSCSSSPAAQPAGASAAACATASASLIATGPADDSLRRAADAAGTMTAPRSRRAAIIIRDGEEAAICSSLPVPQEGEEAARVRATASAMMASTAAGTAVFSSAAALRPT